MRKADEKRTTRETDITLSLDLDGSGKNEIDTGIGFFDHMLDSFARHGLFDLKVHAKGDLAVDSHHTVEDTGIVLGTAIRNAVGDKEGIRRFGQRLLPMDDALVLCAVDLSGRPWLGFDVSFSREQIGYMDTEMVKEFFYAVSYSAMMNIHLKQVSGENHHHIIEALFKSFGVALSEAVSCDERIEGIRSTKGSL
jgi:imidazoleglycerol-phosphate dehydratase